MGPRENGISWILTWDLDYAEENDYVWRYTMLIKVSPFEMIRFWTIHSSAGLRR